MDTALRERFARLGPVHDVGRVPCGSPTVLVLHVPQGRPLHKPVDAMMALVRRGMTMLHAKRAIDALKTEGRVSVDLPALEDPRALVRELAEAGVASALVPPPDNPDVRAT